MRQVSVQKESNVPDNSESGQANHALSTSLQAILHCSFWIREGTNN
jgi:hypothetical protein